MNSFIRSKPCHLFFCKLASLLLDFRYGAFQIALSGEEFKDLPVTDCEPRRPRKASFLQMCHFFHPPRLEHLVHSIFDPFDQVLSMALESKYFHFESQTLKATFLLPQM